MSTHGGWNHASCGFVETLGTRRKRRILSRQPDSSAALSACEHSQMGAPMVGRNRMGMILPDRTTHTSITFLHPFSLSDVEEVQPAGTYSIETIDTTLDNLSFVAYRRVSTSIMLPAVGTAAPQRQVIFVDPSELEAALKRDAQIEQD
jgi:hypothetical protein